MEQKGSCCARQLRYGFTFSADGQFAAAAQQTDAALELEVWRRAGTSWRTSGTGVPVALGDQFLPLRPGRVLLRTSRGRGHCLYLIDGVDARVGEPAVARPRFQRVQDIRLPGVRLLPPTGEASHALAVVLLHDRETTRLARLVRGGRRERWRLEPCGPQLQGRCFGGVWLDGGGRRLALNVASSLRCKAVAVDLVSGQIDDLFAVSPLSDDRVELYSPASSLLVVHTNIGGIHRLGFAHVSAGEPIWLPEITSSPTELHALALDPAGARVLLHERRGVTSHLSVFHAGARRLTRLVTPKGSFRGGAVWTTDGISVAWSTPSAPHAILRFRRGRRPDRHEHRQDSRVARVARVPGAAGTMEAIVYGDTPNWVRSPTLLLALHGGPVSAWRYEYDPLFDALRSEGFGVLAPNQRGSSGYGYAHIRPIVGAWGDPDLDDVVALLRWLERRRRGLRRPGLLGISYGAYLALLGACVVPELVSACIAVAPFLSPAALYAQASAAVRAQMDDLGARGASAAGGEPPDVAELLPRLTASTLILHGRNDDTIPVVESRRLTTQLASLGHVDHTYVEIPDGGHDLLTGRHSAAVRGLILQFLRSDGSPELRSDWGEEVKR